MRTRTTIITCLATLVAIWPSSTSVAAPGELEAVFAGAEQRFQTPARQWYFTTQQALREEAARVERALEAEGPEYADAWRTHLRWDLLERNLVPGRTASLIELQQVRRWMYSNQVGLESATFAQLRARLDDHLDAAFAFSHADLHAAFLEKVADARRQCRTLSREPCDRTAAELGRTLGWFERTKQLTAEVAQVRSLASQPNAQVAIRGRLISRVMNALVGEVTETVPVIDVMRVPPTRRLQRPRTLQVRGSASTAGRIQVEPTPNDLAAELAFVYQGSIYSSCRAEAGPVTFHLETSGSARAAKPFYLSPQGLQLGETTVDPQVDARVTGISGRSVLARRVASRRAANPATQAFTRAQTQSMTGNQLRRRYDERIEAELGRMRGEGQRLEESLGAVGEALAPVVREGAVPYFHSARSSRDGIVLNACARNREQFGAATSCDDGSVDGDILVRMHVSFANNMAETMLGGKRLSDTFVMKYAQLFHAELPLPLMVHSRAKRWAVVPAKRRPIELMIPQRNRFQFRLRFDALEIDGRQMTAPSTATITYDLLQDEFGDYLLQRVGDIDLETTLTDDAGRFLREKIDGLFGPAFVGGGFVIPEGGLLGALQGLHSRGVHAEGEWIVVGLDVPLAVIEEIIRLQGMGAAGA